MDVEFLRTVIPDNNGWYLLATIPEPKRDGAIRHYAVKTNVHDGAYVAKNHNEDHGIFFTPFTFSQPEAPNRDGRMTKGALRKRDDLKLTCKLLWLDIDLGNDKHYANESDALKAMIAHVGPKMPMPTFVVKTGGGLHLYWVLAEALGLKDWQNAAGRFVQYWKDAGLRFDHVSKDSARVLRVPGTNNMKTGQPRACARTKHEGLLCSNGYIDRWPVPTVGTSESIPALFSRGSEDMGHDDVHSKFLTAEISQNCEIFKRIAANNGADCSEPLWKDVLQTVAMTEDKDEWAHKLSSGHPGYSAEDTERKLAERDLGRAILCSTYEEHFSDDPCEGCPLKGKGHSPLKFGTGKPPVIASPVLPCQPEPVEITNRGMYLVEPGDEDTAPKRHFISGCSPTRVEAVDRVTEAGDTIATLELDLIRSTGTQNQVVLNMNKMVRGSEAQVEFQNKKISFEGSGEKLRQVYMSWHNALRKAGLDRVADGRYGWVWDKSQNITGFAHGDTVYLPDGSEQEQALSSIDHNVRTLAPNGDAAPWTKVANAILQDKRPQMHILLATAFSAPLVRLLPSDPYTSALSIYSHSGTGKSTALRVAAAVWGLPRPSVSTDATETAANNELKRQPTLPFYWDETKTEQSRINAKALAYQVTQGTSKNRGRTDGTNRQVVEFYTTVILTSNEPFAGEFASSYGAAADSARLLEVKLDKYQTKIPAELLAPLHQNHGVIGAQYAKYMVQHTKDLSVALGKMTDHLWAKLPNFDSSIRFHVNLAATLLLGASIAKAQGYADFDVAMMEQELLRAIEQSAHSAAAAANFGSCDTILKDYWASTFGYTVVSGEKEAHGSNNVRADTRHGVYWQLDADTGELTIHSAPFRNWHKERYGRSMSVTTLLDLARDEGFHTVGVRSVRVHVGPKEKKPYKLASVIVPDLAENPLKAQTGATFPTDDAASQES